MSTNVFIDKSLLYFAFSAEFSFISYRIASDNIKKIQINENNEEGYNGEMG